jgi:type I restriction enzyme, S subunit
MRDLGSNIKLPKGWRFTRFDEFLKKIDRKIIIQDDVSYKCVGVRWYAMGAFVREHLLGMNIARKQQWIIKAGDVVYNKLFAWKGSFAIADDSVNGCIVSDKFPTYEVNLEIIHPDFLRYYFRTPQLAQQAQDLSKGAAAISKLTLNPPQFWDLIIPLPPLEEQRRIVAKIEELAAKIEKAMRLRQQTNDETDLLLPSLITRLLGSIPINRYLGEVLLEDPKNGWSARCDNVETGIPVLTLSAVTGFRYREKKFKRTSEPISSSAGYWLRKGDLLITRSNSLELVGHAAIYNGVPNPCIYPDLMMRLVVDEKGVEKGFVHWWLRSAMVREYIQRSAKGTSPTMKKISQTTVRNIPFPSSKLSLSEQRRIIAYLDDMQRRLDTLEQIQFQTTTDFDLLLPSILDKAFKGEL